METAAKLVMVLYFGLLVGREIFNEHTGRLLLNTFYVYGQFLLHTLDTLCQRWGEKMSNEHFLGSDQQSVNATSD